MVEDNQQLIAPGKVLYIDVHALRAEDDDSLSSLGSLSSDDDDDDDDDDHSISPKGPERKKSRPRGRRHGVPDRKRNATCPNLGIKSTRGLLDDDGHNSNGSLSFHYMSPAERSNGHSSSSRWDSSSKIHIMNASMATLTGGKSFSRWQDSVNSLDFGCLSDSVGKSLNESASSRWSASMSSLQKDQISVTAPRIPPRQRSGTAGNSKLQNSGSISGASNHTSEVELDGTEQICRNSMRARPRQRLPNRQKSWGKELNLSRATASVVRARQESWKKQNSQRSIDTTEGNVLSDDNIVQNLSPKSVECLSVIKGVRSASAIRELSVPRSILTNEKLEITTKDEHDTCSNPVKEKNDDDALLIAEKEAGIHKGCHSFDKSHVSERQPCLLTLLMIDSTGNDQLSQPSLGPMQEHSTVPQGQNSKTCSHGITAAGSRLPMNPPSFPNRQATIGENTVVLAGQEMLPQPPPMPQRQTTLRGDVINLNGPQVSPPEDAPPAPPCLPQRQTTATTSCVYSQEGDMCILGPPPMPQRQVSVGSSRPSMLARQLSEPTVVSTVSKNDQPSIGEEDHHQQVTSMERSKQLVVG